MEVLCFGCLRESDKFFAKLIYGLIMTGIGAVNQTASMPSPRLVVQILLPDSMPLR
jgi:hypothetical protein